MSRERAIRRSVASRLPWPCRSPKKTSLALEISSSGSYRRLPSLRLWAAQRASFESGSALAALPNNVISQAQSHHRLEFDRAFFALVLGALVALGGRS